MYNTHSPLNQAHRHLTISIWPPTRAATGALISSRSRSTWSRVHPASALNSAGSQPCCVSYEQAGTVDAGVLLYLSQTVGSPCQSRDESVTENAKRDTTSSGKFLRVGPPLHKIEALLRFVRHSSSNGRKRVYGSPDDTTPACHTPSKLEFCAKHKVDGMVNVLS